MYDFHKDKETYFQIQYQNSKNSILPFLDKQIPLGPNTQVLEIGSAEGGNLKPFAEADCQCTGIELSASRTDLARQFLEKEVNAKRVTFINQDIYEIEPKSISKEGFDLIFLKDVLEHIPNQERLMSRLKDFLKPCGKIFLGFPSWYMAFGGHQQMCKNKTLSSLPYFHLLPTVAYKQVLKWFNKNDSQNEMLMEVKDTRISIQRFEKILKKENYIVNRKQFYFIPPIYYYKFSAKTRKLPAFISGIPLLREPFITSAYYLVEQGEK